MSWLLVAFIPGLLMLATFGLDRLEAGLRDGTASNDDVAELLEQAKAESVRTPPARSTADFATQQETLPLRETWRDDYSSSTANRALPTRVYVHHRTNPQFQATRQADRV